MKISEVTALAKELMREHGIGHWGLGYVNHKTTAGWCHTYHWRKDPLFSRGKIELSTPYMEAFGYDEVRETILHEIAHARVKERGHGPEWKAFAKSIGSTGERCVSSSAPRPKIDYKWTGYCPQGHKFQRHRLSWRAQTETYCTKCRKAKLSAAIVWHETATMKPAVEDLPVVLPSPKPVKVDYTAVKAEKPMTWRERYDKGYTMLEDNDDW